MAIVLLGVAVMVTSAIPLARGARDTSPAKRPRGAAPPGVLRLVGPADATIARFSLRPFTVARRVDASGLAAELRRRVPGELLVRGGRSRVLYRLQAAPALRRALALGPRGGTVRVPATAVAASVRAPVVRQRLRNNCETAALEILLATTGRRADQLSLQRALPTSGPLDPTGSGSDRTWGDPERGFVGRPAGGGAAGGFGVYQRPIASLARKQGRPLTDLSGRPASVIYRRLRSGRAVMAWVGLTYGPYETWRSPTGRAVSVNVGEHTVVVSGFRSDGALEVVNPLRGTFEIWTQAKFESWWSRLGRRALST
ncbi:MAG: C39 family peptidase [Solirubrobacteraceae bacterium]